MAVRPDLEFDGKGYISNVGASKYWGVNKATESATQSWRVMVHSGKGATNPEDQVMHAYAWGWRMTEKEAAWIAASFYETPAINKNFIRHIPSSCGKYQYRINSSRHITRVHRDLSDMLDQINNPLLVEVKGVYPTEPETEVETPEVNNPLIKMANQLDVDNKEEMDYVRELTSMIINKNGSPAFYNLIQDLAKLGVNYV